MKDFKKKTYISFNQSGGYPTGENLYYECAECGSVIPSITEDNTMCSCRNIVIDVDAGRVSIKDHSKVKLFSTMS